MGGGGSSRNFSDLDYRIGFSGGGVVAEIFPVNKSITFPRFRDILGTFSAHLRIIHRLWALAEIQGHFPCLLTHSNRVTTSIHSGKKHLQKVWGGPWPPWPPPGYATGCTGCNRRRQGNVLCSARYYPYSHPCERRSLPPWRL